MLELELVGICEGLIVVLIMDLCFLFMNILIDCEVVFRILIILILEFVLCVIFIEDGGLFLVNGIDYWEFVGDVCFILFRFLEVLWSNGCKVVFLLFSFFVFFLLDRELVGFCEDLVLDLVLRLVVLFC